MTFKGKNRILAAVRKGAPAVLATLWAMPSTADAQERVPPASDDGRAVLVAPSTVSNAVRLTVFALRDGLVAPSAIDPAIRAEIMRAGDMIVNSQNRIEYMRDVCGRISSVSNGVLRRKCFNLLMDVAFASRLELVGDVANSEAARRELGWAHTALRTLAEEVWKMRWTEGASPEEQLEPWFRLIEKMKDEEIRLKTDSNLYAPFVEFAKRLYRRCEEAGAFTSHEEKMCVTARMETVCGIPVSVKR